MIRRGDVVTAVMAGDYGKPRPVLVIQSDFLQELDSVVICPLTSALRHLAFRVTVEPDSGNGLKQRSQVMVDKVTAVQHARLGEWIGRLDIRGMEAVERALLLVIGIA